MTTLDPTQLTDLDRLLFDTLLRSTAQTPMDLVDLIAPVLGSYGHGEISEALARLALRGLVVELSDRRFYAPLIATGPAHFAPLAESEWDALSPAT